MFKRMMNVHSTQIRNVNIALSMSKHLVSSINRLPHTYYSLYYRLLKYCNDYDLKNNCFFFSEKK